MVDLCAAPGGWSEVSSAAAQSPLVVAVDLAAMAPLPNVRCLQADLTHPSTAAAILALLAPHRADVLLCDCAPDVLQQSDVDELLQRELVKAALSVAAATLRSDGSFVCKVFRGPRLPSLLRRCQRLFASVQLAKPAASRNSSMEAFIVARHFAADSHGREQLEEGSDGHRDSDSDSDSDSGTSDSMPQLQQSVAVPFVSCGDELGLDSDKTYPLSFRIPSTAYSVYQPLAPAALPIEPPYKQSILRQKDKANSQPSQNAIQSVMLYCCFYSIPYATLAQLQHVAG